RRRPHPNPSARRLPRVGERHRRRPRPEPGAPRHLAPRPRRPPRSLAPHAMTTCPEPAPLRAAFALRLDSFELDLDLTAPAGAVTAVLGPNGAGKTTLLRAIAGHLAIDRGSIALGGTALDEPPAVFVPPERRGVGIVHQDHLLFPHLSALDNVAFPRRARREPRRQARSHATALLERLGVGAQAQA